ncbi:MAG: TRAP transporter permease, partial [Acidaminococcaceae bacterium]
PMRTGVVAAKLAIAAFIVPYIFVLSPEILMINATIPKIAMATITALIGMWGVSVAMIGYCVKTTNMLQRILFFFGGVMLIDPGLLTDVIGITVLVATYAWQVIEKKKMNKVAA